MTRPKIIARVLREYGGPKALADILGVSRQAVWQWQQIPVKYIRQIEKDTGIPRQLLRPDLYA